MGVLVGIAVMLITIIIILLLYLITRDILIAVYLFLTKMIKKILSKIKDILMTILAMPTGVAMTIVFLFLIFEWKWYSMGIGVLSHSYVLGIIAIILAVFVTFFCYSVMDFKLPKIESGNSFLIFIGWFPLLYLTVYFLIGQFLWGFLLNNLTNLSNRPPETITHIMPIVCLFIVLLYRITLYADISKIQTHPRAVKLFNAYPFLDVKQKIIDFKQIMMSFIIGGIFISCLFLFLNLSVLSSNLSSIAFKNILLLGLIFVSIELYFWLKHVQFKKEVEKQNADFEKQIKTKKHPIQDRDYLVKRLKKNPHLSSFITKYKKNLMLSRVILLVIFIAFSSFTFYYSFTHVQNYEQREVPVTAFLLKFNLTETNLFPVHYVEPKPLEMSSFSYEIIKNSDGKLMILTKTDKDRHDSGIFNYNVVGYLNVERQKTKSLMNLPVLANVSEDKLQKETDAMTNQYGEILSDGEILLFLYDHNITETCSIFTTLITNQFDPMYDLNKYYLFTNANKTDTIIYSEQFHIVPFNQRILYYSQDRSMQGQFKQYVTSYPVSIDNVTMIMDWNLTKAYAYCLYEND